MNSAGRHQLGAWDPGPSDELDADRDLARPVRNPSDKIAKVADNVRCSSFGDFSDLRAKGHLRFWTDYLRNEASFRRADLIGRRVELPMHSRDSLQVIEVLSDAATLLMNARVKLLQLVIIDQWVIEAAVFEVCLPPQHPQHQEFGWTQGSVVR